MTETPDPTVAALAVQLAALRGQVRMLTRRLDQAGLKGDLDLAARFEELARTVAMRSTQHPPEVRPRRTGWIWTARHTRLSSPSFADGSTRCCAPTTAATNCVTGSQSHIHVIWEGSPPSPPMASHLQRPAPRPPPCPGVLRPLATRHHAPRQRIHSGMCRPVRPVAGACCTTGQHDDSGRARPPRQQARRCSAISPAHAGPAAPRSSRQ